MTSEEQTLKEQLAKFELPDTAIEWLCDLFAVIQFFDDVADSDVPTRDELNRALWVSIIGFNTNDFFIQNNATLLPILATQILKWQGSDMIERHLEVSEQSFVARAGFYDVVMAVVLLCKGRVAAEELAAGVINLYGEKYKDYQEEFA